MKNTTPFRRNGLYGFIGLWFGFVRPLHAPPFRVHWSVSRSVSVSPIHLFALSLLSSPQLFCLRIILTLVAIVKWLTVFFLHLFCFAIYLTIRNHKNHKVHCIEFDYVTWSIFSFNALPHVCVCVYIMKNCSTLSEFESIAWHLFCLCVCYISVQLVLRFNSAAFFVQLVCSTHFFVI